MEKNSTILGHLDYGLYFLKIGLFLISKEELPDIHDKTHKDIFDNRVNYVSGGRGFLNGMPQELKDKTKGSILNYYKFLDEFSVQVRIASMETWIQFWIQSPLIFTNTHSWVNNKGDGKNFLLIRNWQDFGSNIDIEEYVSMIKTFHESKGDNAVLYYEDIISDLNLLREVATHLGFKVDKKVTSLKNIDKAAKTCYNRIVNPPSKPKALTDAKKKRVQSTLKKELGSLYDEYLGRYEPKTRRKNVKKD